jgi:hypothetical protein
MIKILSILQIAALLAGVTVPAFAVSLPAKSGCECCCDCCDAQNGGDCGCTIEPVKLVGIQCMATRKQTPDDLHALILMNAWIRISVVGYSYQAWDPPLDPNDTGPPLFILLDRWLI